MTENNTFSFNYSFDFIPFFQKNQQSRVRLFPLESYFCVSLREWHDTRLSFPTGDTMILSERISINLFGKNNRYNAVTATPPYLII
ncbi:MAG: hypothetical protein M0P70_10440 [Desulfobulbaceae bacterium]|nr:hypothetical protein [Desulfobulbaceae bacterium]